MGCLKASVIRKVQAEHPMSGLPDIGTKMLGEPRRMGAQVSDKVLGN
jgi:hypothetical protein